MPHRALPIEPRTGVLLTLTVALCVATPGAGRAAPLANAGAACAARADESAGAGDPHRSAGATATPCDCAAAVAEDTPPVGDDIHAVVPVASRLRSLPGAWLPAAPVPARSPRPGQVLRLAPKTSPPLPRV